jgi:uncharacterized protein with ParB-like and HNH nuclease domain
MKLHSLNDIFERRILRIPDYQRGYAWLEHQLVDFWEDIFHLDVDRVHYTGVITLEPVKKSLWTRWDTEQWIIDGVGFKPFYVVDGQQRLTTAMILIQAILESVDTDTQLNYQSVESIRKQYILFKADDEQRESFIFGYEKDNPSDEFLKTRIFGEHSHTDLHQETLYTKNLSFAKAFFNKQLASLDNEQIALIFKKLTQKLKFNLYEIDEEIDVFVTFETMNNRGKPLTTLELLKNRLIYLSTLFTEHTGHEVLRTKINDSWKTIYEYLGKNSSSPLRDDLFLQNHWFMYFKYTRKKGDDYKYYLLDEKFTARNVTHPKNEIDRLTVSDIDDYVTNLQKSVVPWFYIHNPYFKLVGYDNSQNKMLIDRLDRSSFKAFKPLLLAAFVTRQDIESINELLVAAERYNFTLFSLSRRRANLGDSDFYIKARELLADTTDIPAVIATINEYISDYFDPHKFLLYIQDKYDVGQAGFYKWDGIRYFLFEHEQWLNSRGKQSTLKLDWEMVTTNKKDHVTIEHIFPQTPSEDYWVKRFGSLTKDETLFVAHSIGNLVPLSRAKNSSLQNDNFDLKKNNGNGVGFYNGSASENELAQEPEWLPESVLSRGLQLLAFMEERWQIVIGDDEFKTKLLHMDFLQNSLTANDQEVK